MPKSEQSVRNLRRSNWTQKVILTQAATHGIDLTYDDFTYSDSTGWEIDAMPADQWLAERL